MHDANMIDSVQCARVQSGSCFTVCNLMHTCSYEVELITLNLTMGPSVFSWPASRGVLASFN